MNSYSVSSWILKFNFKIDSYYNIKIRSIKINNTNIKKYNTNEINITSDLYTHSNLSNLIRDTNHVLIIIDNNFKYFRNRYN